MSLFAFLYHEMPTDFFLNQDEYNLTFQDSQEARADFNATDLEVYDSFGNDSMAFEYTSLDNVPSEFETSISDRYVEVWWGYERSTFPPYVYPAFEIRDTSIGWFGIRTLNERALLIVNGQEIGTYLTAEKIDSYGLSDLENLTISTQATYISTSIILHALENETIGESFDNGELGYSISYEIDFEAMKPSAWMLIGQLITFQAPNFGLPTIIEQIVSYTFSLGVWIVVALIAYTIITKLIPTIQGGVEG